MTKSSQAWCIFSQKRANRTVIFLANRLNPKSLIIFVHCVSGDCRTLVLLDGVGAPVIRRHKGKIAKVGRLDKDELVHVSNEIDMQRAGGDRLTG